MKRFLNLKTNMVVILLLMALPASAQWVLKPDVIKNYDGDTFTARFEIWPNTFVVTAVRVLGVDTPEMRGACDQERALAKKAKQFTAHALLGDDVTVIAEKKDKYGRILAWVYVDGKALDLMLIKEGLGRENHGEKRQSWCD